MKSLFQVVSLLVFIHLCSQQGTEGQPSGHPCHSKKTCGDCIQTNSKCSWCKQAGFDADGRHQCDFQENLIINTCDILNITTPKSEFNVTKSDPFRSGPNDIVVQVRPQQITVRVRPNDPVKINLTFEQAKNYPVDLYYVMDLSHTMLQHKRELANLGQSLADKMHTITTDFRLGFGTFVDKPVMPYVNMAPGYRDFPCGGNVLKDSCEAAYGFKHRMNLSIDARLFAQRVNETKISGNIDTPEGGFDAIMQAIVCEESIGWRKQARRLLIFSTDDIFHHAGDAKLGGIVTPNDERCHLDNNGTYTYSELQDYPSVAQLNRQLRKNNVALIFAVTKEQTRLYTELSGLLKGSAIGTLADGSNIVHLIANFYEAIRSKVEFVHDAPKEIEVKFYSKCLGNDRVETSSCDVLKIGEQVLFETEITLNSCSDRDKFQFNIKPFGINEGLVVNVEAICKCDCEQPGDSERKENSTKCSFNGDHECGRCTCESGRKGRQCNVDENDPDARCRAPNNPVACSGHGACVDGVCNCSSHSNPNMKFSGEFCECDNSLCILFEGKICGGHGACVCGECKCESRYTGDDCSYQESSCNEKINCALCQAFQSGALGSDECRKCPGQVSVVDEVKEDFPRVTMCTGIDQTDGCKFSFTYEYDENQTLILKAQKRRTDDCPSPVEVLPIIFGTIGGTLLIGIILLLIWRVYASIQDNREFSRFMKERDAAKWEKAVNPIYKQVSTSYNNPAFNRR